MLKILLTSNGFYTSEIKQRFFQLIDYEVVHKKATVITTASPQKQNNKFAIKAREDLLGMGFSKVDFIDIEFEQPDILKDYNVIYINGGNPFYLLYYLKKSKADLTIKNLAKEGTVFVGVSAGAMIFGSSIEVVNLFTPYMNNVNIKDLSAIGLTNKIIFPHYDREDLFSNPEGRVIEERIRDYEKKSNQPVYRIRDEGYIVIN